MKFTMPALASTSNLCSDSDFGSTFLSGFERTVRFLQSLGARRELAEEIAQAAWTRGWERRDQLRKESSIVAWVNSIAKNILKEARRLAARLAPLAENRHVGSRSVQAVDLDSIVDVRRAMLTEDKKDGRILEMFYSYGYAAGEIADRLRVSPTAIRIRLCRGRRRLKEQLA
jgi:RNA polymerase sigma factor (sigma-70 family)